MKGQFKRFTEAEQQAMTVWILKLGSWNTMATFTFPDRAFKMRDGSKKMCGVKSDSARIYFEKFMRKHFPRVDYFYSIEPNPSRDGHHIHAVMEGEFQRSEMWRLWFEERRSAESGFGARNRIEPVEKWIQAAAYVAKYIVKDQAWWNFKLGFENWQLNAVNPEKVLV